MTNVIREVDEELLQPEPWKIVCRSDDGKTTFTLETLESKSTKYALTMAIAEKTGIKSSIDLKLGEKPYFKPIKGKSTTSLEKLGLYNCSVVTYSLRELSEEEKQRIIAEQKIIEYENWKKEQLKQEVEKKLKENQELLAKEEQERKEKEEREAKEREAARLEKEKLKEVLGKLAEETESDSSVPVGSVLPCPACTYYNPIGTESCEMCGTGLAGGAGGALPE